MASTKQQQSLSNFCQRENLTALRDEAVANYRDRIQSGKRTKMTSDERQIFIDWFIEHLTTLDSKDAIQSFCEREIALLEEGYPQRERRKNVASTKSSPRKGLTPMGGEQLFPLLTQRMATEDFEKRFFNHPVH
jgi:hypothetical protein